MRKSTRSRDCSATLALAAAAAVAAAVATLATGVRADALPVPPARGYRVVLEADDAGAAALAAVGYGRRELRVWAGRMEDATTARGGVVTALTTDLCASRTQSFVQLNATGVAATCRAAALVWPPAPVFGDRGAAWTRAPAPAPVPCPRAPALRCDAYTAAAPLRNVTAYYRAGTATPVAAAVAVPALGTHWVRVRLWDPWPPALALPRMCRNLLPPSALSSDSQDGQQEQQVRQEEEEEQEESSTVPPLFPCLSHTRVSAGSRETVLFTQEVWVGERAWRSDYTAAVALGALQRLAADQRTTYRGDLARVYTVARATNSCRTDSRDPAGPAPQPALLGVDVAAAAWTRSRDTACALAAATRDCDVYRAAAARGPALTLRFEHGTRTLLGGTVRIGVLELPLAVEAADAAAVPQPALFVPDAAVCGAVAPPPAVSDAFFAQCAAYCTAPHPDRPWSEPEPVLPPEASSGAAPLSSSHTAASSAQSSREASAPVSHAAPHAALPRSALVAAACIAALALWL